MDASSKGQIWLQFTEVKCSTKDKKGGLCSPKDCFRRLFILVDHNHLGWGIFGMLGRWASGKLKFHHRSSFFDWELEIVV